MSILANCIATKLSTANHICLWIAYYHRSKFTAFAVYPSRYEKQTQFDDFTKWSHYPSYRSSQMLRRVRIHKLSLRSEDTNLVHVGVSNMVLYMSYYIWGIHVRVVCVHLTVGMRVTVDPTHYCSWKLTDYLITSVTVSGHMAWEWDKESIYSPSSPRSTCSAQLGFVLERDKKTKVCKGITMVNQRNDILKKIATYSEESCTGIFAICEKVKATGCGGNFHGEPNANIYCRTTSNGIRYDETNCSRWSQKFRTPSGIYHTPASARNETMLIYRQLTPTLDFVRANC